MAIFGQLSSFNVCQIFFTNSINQRINTEKQSPIKIKYSSENEYVNGIQKVLQQNFGAYEDLWCYNRPTF